MEAKVTTQYPKPESSSDDEREVPQNRMPDPNAIPVPPDAEKPPPSPVEEPTRNPPIREPDRKKPTEIV